MARVVLDARAIAQLLEHLKVEAGPLLQSLGLQKFTLLPQFNEPFFQFYPDRFNGMCQHRLRCDVMAGRVNRKARQLSSCFAPEWINFEDLLHLVSKKLNAHRSFFFIRGEDFHHISPHPEGASMEIHIIALIVNLHQLSQHFVPLNLLPLVKMKQ